MTDIRIIEHDEQATAGVRETVPMSELTEFFSRAYTQTMAALQAHGTYPAGPPFGKYYGMPTEVVDVEAGFPVAATIATADGVVSGILPAGTIVTAIHVGPYDSMADTYAEVQRFFAENHLVPSDVMWESYLSDPELEPDPAKWRTLICWPVTPTEG